DTHDIQLKIDQGLKIKVVEREFFSLCQNLLSNAIKYSDKGSTIELCWNLSEDGQACLIVSDNGEGIAAEHLKRLTERFYRINVSRSRQVGGTGLGLSIVKHIMENYGGYLDIESEFGVGSTFKACFPVYRVLQKKLSAS
ncbi:MAG: ATP-binding protein, partial [Kangiellaceae bacterium]|nr:ATP-binding protein [Kangiellaceae bacterium]